MTEDKESDDPGVAEMTVDTDTGDDEDEEDTPLEELIDEEEDKDDDDEESNSGIMYSVE